MHLSGEILDYLLEHPNAVDTPEGIALWWLQRQRYEATLKNVRCALDELERRRLLTKTVLADGTVLYGVSLSPMQTMSLQ